MNFAINPSLKHINLPQEYIDSLYRSTSEVQLPDARFRGHPCEAYICISKIEKTVKAYVALLDMGLKSVLVYTSDFETVNPADYPKVETQAQEFVKAMGFTMEKVNLDFSPAMREVIIKGFRVMRPPPPPPPRKQDRSPKGVHSADHHLLNVPAQLEDALHREFQIDELPAELTSLRAELSSARAVIEKLTREKVSKEQSALHEIAAMKSAVEQANDSRIKSEERFAQELQKLKVQQGTSKTVGDDDEKDKLRAHFQKISAEAKNSQDRLRKEISELQEKYRLLESERVRIESLLAAENSSSNEKLAALTAENASLKTKLSEEPKKLEEAKTSEDRLRKEISELQEKYRLLESERVRIESLLAAANSSANEKLAALTAENASLKTKLSKAQAANLAASDKIAVLARFETSWREGQQREEDLCRNIDLLQSQLDAMGKELQSSQDKVNTEESLILKIAELETAAEAAKSEIQLLRKRENKEESLIQKMTELEAAAETAKSEIELLRNREKNEEPLILKISELEAAAESAKSEIERLRDRDVDTVEYLPELKELEAEKKIIESEYVRLANESREKEIKLSDSLSSAEAEVQRLSRELEIQTQVAAMEQAALRTELRRIVMEGAPAATQVTGSGPSVIVNPAAHQAVGLAVRAEPAHAPPLKAPAVVEEIQSLPEEDIEEDDSDDEPDLPVKGYPEIVSGLINEFGSFYSESGHSSTEFSIDPSITSIEYTDPAEIVALLYSSNTVQAVPVGSSIQRCKGYVIGLMKSGSYQTYIIWYLTESKKSVICIPQEQPEDSSECIRTLQDAVSYFETVGFMMEFEELGSSTKSYKKMLKKVPALKMVAKS